MSKETKCASKDIMNLSNLSATQTKELKAIKQSIKSHMKALKEKAKAEGFSHDYIKKEQKSIKQKHKEKLPTILTKEQLKELKEIENQL